MPSLCPAKELRIIPPFPVDAGFEHAQFGFLFGQAFRAAQKQVAVWQQLADGLANHFAPAFIVEIEEHIAQENEMKTRATPRIEQVVPDEFHALADLVAHPEFPGGCDEVAPLRIVADFLQGIILINPGGCGIQHLTGKIGAFDAPIPILRGQMLFEQHGRAIGFAADGRGGTPDAKFIGGVSAFGPSDENTDEKIPVLFVPEEKGLIGGKAVDEEQLLLFPLRLLKQIEIVGIRRELEPFDVAHQSVLHQGLFAIGQANAGSRINHFLDAPEFSWMQG